MQEFVIREAMDRSRGTEVVPDIYHEKERAPQGLNVRKSTVKTSRSMRNNSQRKQNLVKDLQRQVDEQMKQLTLLEEENKEMKLRQEVLQTMIRRRNENIHLVKHGCSITMTKHVLLDGSADLQNWGLNDLVAHYKKVVRTFAVLLSQEEEPGELRKDAEEEILHVGREMSYVLATLCYHNPLPAFEMDKINLETMEVEEPPPEIWQQVFSAMQLSTELKEKLLLCYQLFMKEEKRIAEDANRLVHQHQSLMKDVKVAGGDPLVDGELLRLVDKLNRNLRRGRSIANMLQSSAEVLLSPVQSARACVAAYPFTPSLVKALQYLAEEPSKGVLGDTSVEGLAGGGDQARTPRPSSLGELGRDARSEREESQSTTDQLYVFRAS